MRRPLHIALITAILLVQWHLVLHVYQDHDAGEVCELCAVADLHHHTAPSLPPVVVVPPVFPEFFPPLPTVSATPHTLTPYQVRAPPFA